MEINDGAHSSTDRSAEPTEESNKNYEIQTGARIPRWMHVVGAIVFFLLSLFSFYQTQIVTELMGRLLIDRAILDGHVQQSIRQRMEVASRSQGQSHTDAQPAVTPHRVFFGSDGLYPNRGKLITNATNALFNDQNVCDSFPEFDKISLGKTSAVIVPLWDMDKLGNRDQAGMTEAGWACSDNDSTTNPGGTTIREKPVGQDCFNKLKEKNITYETLTNGMPKMTKTGTPTIALGKQSMRNLDELKLTLAHEFLHSHSVPAYKPIFNYVHDDLTYLPEYNQFIEKANLLKSTTTKWQQENLLRLVGCLLIVGAVLNAYRVRGRTP